MQEESCQKDEGSYKSDANISASQAALDYQSSLHAGSVIQQLQNVAEQERIITRKAVKSFSLCTLSCSRAHSPYYILISSPAKVFATVDSTSDPPSFVGKAVLPSQHQTHILLMNSIPHRT